ncbi:MAG: hypothetical protein PCFJNLEI_00630 [Verrucomicrobiae bacterium]|nr:hypothetical protein [Verrucomicrobiae bacterium]
MTDTLRWKPDWPQARQALTAWWEHRGLALAAFAPKDKPWEDIPKPEVREPLAGWTDADYWAHRALYDLSRTYCGGAAFPAFWTCIGGPGSLGLFLGAIGHPAPDTLWYEPVIHDPDTHPPLQLDRTGAWWHRHIDVLAHGVRENHGRYLVGLPDLIENIDTLAQLRAGQLLLIDLLERPEWVKAQIARINQLFFETYDAMLPYVRDPWGGTTFTAFGLWGPGKVAKVQCDFCCMISPDMFREFVVPALTEQCAWLDYSMYHLDGTNALQHLDALLAIEPLDAIEWTPQAGLPGGGSPQWYDLYRRIKAAGKSVQAIGVTPAEVAPLIDAVGADGLYIMSWCQSETEARRLVNG